MSEDNGGQDRRGQDSRGEDNSPNGQTFEDRLQVARSRQGLDAGPASNARGTGTDGVSPMGVGLRVGAELVSALVVAVAIGWLLDRWLHTLPLFLALFVVLGGAAGLANVWRLVGPRRPG